MSKASPGQWRAPRLRTTSCTRSARLGSKSASGVVLTGSSRAAENAGLRQIVYLGGLGDDADDLSPHLRSRRDTEHRLAAGSVPVTTLRAGMVIGRGSAAFETIAALVDRLPVMILPRWAKTATQPIALVDVVRYLAGVCANEDAFGQTYEVGGPEVMSYADMIRRVGRIKGRLPRLVEVPLLRRGSPPSGSNSSHRRGRMWPGRLSKASGTRRSRTTSASARSCPSNSPLSIEPRARHCRKAAPHDGNTCASSGAVISVSCSRGRRRSAARAEVLHRPTGENSAHPCNSGARFDDVEGAGVGSEPRRQRDRARSPSTIGDGRPAPHDS